MVITLRNTVSTIIAGALLATGLGCSRPFKPVYPLDYELWARKGDITPWERDFSEHPEDYEGMSTNPLEAGQVIRTFYLKKGVYEPWASTESKGEQCPADTCPRNYRFTLKAFPKDKETVEADGWQQYNPFSDN